jgi:hypothetical protein
MNISKLERSISHEWECTKRFIKNLMGPGEIIMFIFINLMLLVIPLRMFILTDNQAKLYHAIVVILFSFTGIAFWLKEMIDYHKQS